VSDALDELLDVVALAGMPTPSWEWTNGNWEVVCGSIAGRALLLDAAARIVSERVRKAVANTDVVRVSLADERHLVEEWARATRNR
jgi:hypothetical protein